MHDPECDINDVNLEEIGKPCNCGYDKFVVSMIQFCHCEPYEKRPCDGVLAGGMCDGAKEEPAGEGDDVKDLWLDEW